MGGYDEAVRRTQARAEADRESARVRMAREIREVALGLAITSCSPWVSGQLNVHQRCVLDTAREFERYLTGAASTTEPTTEERQ